MVVSKPGDIQSLEYYTLQDNAPLNTISSNVRELYIRGFYGNNITTLDFSGYSELEILSIGSSCFKNVKSFELVDFDYLKRVEIGYQSFYSSSNTGEFSLMNCPSLKEFSCGYQAFYNYNVFDIDNLNALEMLNIGFQCFYYVKQFKLSSKYCSFPQFNVDLPNLTLAWFYSYCFYSIQSVTFESNQS